MVGWGQDLQCNPAQSSKILYATRRAQKGAVRVRTDFYVLPGAPTQLLAMWVHSKRIA